MKNLYKILYEIEMENLSQAMLKTTELSENTFPEKAEKLICLGEIYYNEMNFGPELQTDIQRLSLSIFNFLNLDNEYSTEEIALYYSGLKLANLLLKDEKIAQMVRNLRNYIFTHNIDQGTLINHPQKRKVDTTVLRTCTPYPLFEPEDLIVVAAYQQILIMAIADFSAQELLDIVLYAIDKRDIYNAKKYLDYYYQNFNVEDAGYLLAENRMKTIMREEIIHEPYGNNHPYLPQKYERSPRNVCTGDAISINAIAENLEELKLILIIDGEEKIIESGKIIDDIIEYKQYQIEAFFEEEVVKYYFKVDDIVSKTYEMPISTKINHLEIAKIENNVIKFENYNQYFFIELAENNNYIFKWSEKIENEALDKLVKLKLEGNLVNVENKLLIDFNESKIICESKEKIELVLKSEKPTKFFGFGQRYNEVCQVNAEIDNYVYSQYKEQGIKTYIPMPIGFTNQNYAIFVNGFCNSKFAIGQNDITVKHRLDEELIILNGTYEEQIKNFHQYTNKPEKLPNYVFGPWMSSNNWDTQAEVLKQKNLTLDYDIPSTVLVIEQWSDEATFYAFNDAKYCEKKTGFLNYEDYQFSGKWPDPKTMVKELHDADLKCFLWQIPVIKYVPNIRHLQKNLDEKFALENDYVIKHQSGKAYRIAEDWFKDSLVIDFTNEEAKKWWFDKRKYLVNDIGIDGFKTDGGECLFGHDLIMNQEKDSEKVRNMYPETYIKSYYEFLQKNTESGFTFSRAGYVNAASYPAHWAGDERSTYDAFDRTIKAGINAGISGITYWGWDLAGFNGDIPTDDLYIRAVQMATFCPIMQYHAESKGEFNQDRTPWNIAERTGNEDVIDIYRYYAHLRMQLIPYIVKEANKALAGGKPLMRAMFLEHNDESMYEITDQYYFGDDILVAPVTKENIKQRNVILKETMINAFSLEEYSAGSHEISFNVQDFPLFLRKNCLIPINIKTEIGVGMKNGDTDNFKYLKFIYPGGDVEYKNDDFEITIKSGKVVTNKEITIIDLTDNLMAKTITSLKWGNKEVPIKTFK